MSKKVDFNFHKNKSDEEMDDNSVDESSTDEVSMDNNNNNSDVEINKDEKKQEKSFLFKGLIFAFTLCVILLLVFFIQSNNTDIVIPDSSIFSNNSNLNSNTDKDNDRNIVVPLNETFKPVKIYKFLDLECPFCKDLDKSINEMKLKYLHLIDFEYVHFPITEVHPYAQELSELFVCLKEQKQHNIFRNKVYDKQDELSSEIIDQILSELVYDRDILNECLESEFLIDELNADKKLVAKYKITSTPNLIVDDKLINSDKESLEEAILDYIKEHSLEVKEITPDEYDEVFAKIRIQSKIDNEQKLTLEEVKLIDPVVPVVVLTSSRCLFCDYQSTLELLQDNLIPNLNIEILDENSKIGLSMMDVHEITSLPAFIFDERIEQTYNFNQISHAIEKKNFTYLLNPLTFKTGYVITTIIDDKFTYKQGSSEVDVKVYNFYNHECEHCAQFYQNVESKLIEELDGKVQFIDKYYISDNFLSSNILAAMTECFYDQTGNHDPIKKELFRVNSDVMQLTNRAVKRMLREDPKAVSDLEIDLTNLVDSTFRQNKIDMEEFNACFDNTKDIDADRFQYTYANYGVRAVPSLIINNQLIEGALDYDGMSDLLNSFLDGSIYENRIDFE